MLVEMGQSTWDKGNYGKPDMMNVYNHWGTLLACKNGVRVIQIH